VIAIMWRGSKPELPSAPDDAVTCRLRRQQLEKPGFSNRSLWSPAKKAGLARLAARPKTGSDKQDRAWFGLAHACGNPAGRHADSTQLNEHDDLKTLDPPKGAGRQAGKASMTMACPP
jgi:hypothetical protein